MRRVLAWVAALLLLCGCTPAADPSDTAGSYTFTDAAGDAVTVTSLDRVAVLYGSFAEVWVLGGGTLCAATEDYVTERGGNLDGVTVVGTVKQPNLETLLSLSPTLVLLSADIASHAALTETLRQLGIPAARMRVDAFADYYAFLQLVTTMTNRPDLLHTYGTEVQREIEEVQNRVAENTSPSVLLLRAYGSGVKVKATDNFAGVMLEELGGEHVTARYPSLLRELSLEAILTADPDHIFVATMGDEQAAMASLEQSLYRSPAWQSLTAVKEGRVHLLPKELFHYKPNARWGESYRFLADCLYGKEESP